MPTPTPSPAMHSLDQLPSGEHATILALHAEAALERRLLALGLRPGQAVCLLRRGLMNGPLHVRVGTTELMLRRQEAQRIDIIQIGRAHV